MHDLIPHTKMVIHFFSDQQLHVVHLEPAPREKCEEVSEVSPHTICTQEKSERSECNVSQTYKYKRINVSFIILRRNTRSEIQISMIFIKRNYW